MHIIQTNTNSIVAFNKETYVCKNMNIIPYSKKNITIILFITEFNSIFSYYQQVTKVKHFT